MVYSISCILGRCIITCYHYICCWHCFRQCAPVTPYIALLAHVVCDQAQACPVSHILLFLILFCCEIASCDLIRYIICVAVIVNLYYCSSISCNCLLIERLCCKSIYSLCLCRRALTSCSCFRLCTRFIQCILVICYILEIMLYCITRICCRCPICSQCNILTWHRKCIISMIHLAIVFRICPTGKLISRFGRCIICNIYFRPFVLLFYRRSIPGASSKFIRYCITGNIFCIECHIIIYRIFKFNWISGQLRIIIPTNKGIRYIINRFCRGTNCIIILNNSC